MSFGPLAGAHGTTAQLANSPNFSTQVSNFLSSEGGLTTVPRAYVNWIVFDEQFNVAASGYDQVGSSGVQKQHQLNGIVVPRNGYIYVYVSNESQNQDVFFDNLQVSHSHGPIVEETHYYPFGLSMAGISSKALKFGEPVNKKKFNGIEETRELDLNELDAFYRNMDPQIGRWWQVDPKPNESISLYTAMENNPILKTDFFGDTSKPYPIVVRPVTSESNMCSQCLTPSTINNQIKLKKDQNVATAQQQSVRKLKQTAKANHTRNNNAVGLSITTQYTEERKTPLADGGTFISTTSIGHTEESKGTMATFGMTYDLSNGGSVSGFSANTGFGTLSWNKDKSYTLAFPLPGDFDVHVNIGPGSNGTGMAGVGYGHSVNNGATKSSDYNYEPGSGVSTIVAGEIVRTVLPALTLAY